MVSKLPYYASSHTNLRKKSTKKKNNKKQTKKIKLSLTRTSTQTLSYAHEVTNENPEIINFVFADPNGDLKFGLKN